MKFKNILNIFVVLAVFAIVASSASALSMIAQFDNSQTTSTINPGQSAGYYVSVVNDQGFSGTTVTSKLYDYTNGTYRFLKQLFSENTNELFFYPPMYTISAEDYNMLPGKYYVEITATETLYGKTEVKTNQLYLYVTGNRPPVADYIYAPTNPSTDDNVTFTSTSYDDDGTIVKEEWFVDGVKIAQGHSPKYQFPTAKTYNVTLLVTDNGSATAQVSKQITVSQGTISNLPPVAQFTKNASTIYVGDDVKFTSTSYDSDGTIVAYSWFVDGVFFSASSQSTLKLNTAGTHTIKLSVQDDDGAISSTTQSINVLVVANQPPVAQFTYSPTNPTTNDNVTFTSSSYDVDGTVVKEEWFVDGVKIAQGHNSVYQFPTAKTYTVLLKVTDNDGATAQTSKTVTVTKGTTSNKPPVAIISAPNLSINPGQSITFVSNSYDPDGYLVSQKWFVDGSVAMTNGNPFTYTFLSPGLYNITLQVLDNDGASAETSVIVNVSTVTPNIPPVADFNYLPVNPTTVDLVVFASTSYDLDGIITKSEWFVDGTKITEGDSFTKYFTTSGTYTVKLKVTDNEGTSSQISKAVTVTAVSTNQPPVAQFTKNASTIYVGDDVKFTSTSYDSDGTIVAYSWFVDGVFFSASSQPTLKLNTAGIHTITLSVQDDDGAVSSTTQSINVLAIANQPPVADFTYSPPNPTTTTNTSFYSISYDPDGNIVAWNWDFNNDGITDATGSNVNYVFPSAGTYVVNLTVVDNDGARTSVTKTIIVTKWVSPLAPVAVIITSNNPTINSPVTIDGSHSYDPNGDVITNYAWKISLAGNVVYQSAHAAATFNYSFNPRGVYDIELTVTDASGLTGSTTTSLMVENGGNNNNVNNQQGRVGVDYFDISGDGYDTISVGKPYVVSTAVSNDYGKTLHDVRATFSLPDIGYQQTSMSYDLRPGESRTIDFTGELPFTKSEVPPGDYIALITIKADDMLRVKYFPLRIE